MSDCLSLRERYFAPGSEPGDAPEWLEHLHVCASCRLAAQGLPLVDRALAEGVEVPVTVPSFDTIALAAEEAAHRQRQRVKVHRSLPFLYTGVAAAAVAAGLVVVVWAGHTRLGRPKLLVPGAELRATSAAQTAILSSGARLQVEAGAIKLSSASKNEERLYLDAGRISLEVPKLASGDSLVLETPDAEVRVRGTRFQVVRAGNETHVQVVEGLVEVRPEGIGRPPLLVRAGQSVTVASAEAYRETLRRSMLNTIDHGEFTAAEKQIGELLGAGADKKQQAEAHALLAWSMAARGKRSEAIARYHQALGLLPEGQQPLWAENACAELAILLEQEAPREAAAAWAECLRRFPHGVHAALARSRARLDKGR